MADDSLTLRDYLIAVQRGQVEDYENNVLELLEPMVLSDYDGWGDAALHNWYQAMLNHLVQELGGTEVVLGMIGEEIGFIPSSQGGLSEN